MLPVENGLFQARSLFFGERMGSIRQITSLVLAGKSRLTGLKVHSWERIKLGIKPQFGDVGLATSFWARCLFF